jgi:flagellar basal body-associated protein FliL
MASSKKVLKLSIIVVLFIFLLSTALVSVMYLTGTKKVDPETGDVITGENVISTGVDSMGL